VKGYPFEVVLPDNVQAQGAILADQIKSLDWRVRKARLFCKAPVGVLAETLARVQALIEPEGAG
jgi:mRNA interferase MazF